MSEQHVARKDDAGKARYDLIPAVPLRELAELYAKGAAKYEARNWEHGLDYGRVFSALQRHVWAWWNGEEFDPVDGQPHLASVAWCALALREYETRGTGQDDRPYVLGDFNVGDPLVATAGDEVDGVYHHGAPCEHTRNVSRSTERPVEPGDVTVERWSCRDCGKTGARVLGVAIPAACHYGPFNGYALCADGQQRVGPGGRVHGCAVAGRCLAPRTAAA